MLVDHRGEPLSKQKPARRSINARYDAAQTTDDNRRHWAMADALSSVSANSAGVRSTLRERSRYEIANNSYARGMLNTIAAYTVGSGPSLQLSHGGMIDEERRQEVQKACKIVEKHFSDWAYYRGLPQKLHTMQLALDGDGEAFALMTTNDRPTMHTPITLDVRLYEADHFDNWTGIGLVEDDAGVRIDSSGSPTEYAFVEDHPGGSYSMTVNNTRWINAESVIHLFRRERPEQLRGIPKTTPALELFAILRRFTLATCTAAETAADFAAILTSEDEQSAEQATPWDRIEIERGGMLMTPAKAKLYQLKAEHPNATFDEFVRAILREIARCLGVPAVIALGDASKYNYASGRLDLQAFIRQMEVERAMLLERDCLDRIFEAWLDEALLIEGFLPPLFVELISFIDWGWRWSGFPHVDRKKEADGQGAELANNTTTLAREYAAKNLDWETELRQRARELTLMRELGLSQPTPVPAVDEVDEEELEEVEQ